MLTECNQFGQLLRGGIAYQATVAHFHHWDRPDPLRHQRTWLESYINFVQGKAHLLLQGLQPGENDRTERATEEAIKIDVDGRGATIGWRRRDRSELVSNPPVAEKARDAGEEMKQCPAQARHAHHPQQGSNPLALIAEIPQT